MKQLTTTFLFIYLGFSAFSYAQEQSDGYLEFNDRKNVVHGVYLGITAQVGEIDDKETYIGGLTVAYVANQQFEVGFKGKFFYSDQDYYNNTFSRKEDLVGAYGGLHLEPIFFSKSRVNLSFPLLLGVGGVGYIRENIRSDDFEDDYVIEETDAEAIFVIEPGVNVLFNVSRYLQLEAGVNYRFTNKVDITPREEFRLNGFSAGVGIKVGVFNMGRNRYRKNLK